MWEIVARIHTAERSWIAPISEGRHFRRTRLAAHWAARKWTRQTHHLCMTWEVRRATP